MSFDAGAVVAKMELGLAGWKASVAEVKKDQESMSGFAMRHKDEIQKLGKEFAVAGAAITGALTAIVLSTVEAEHEFQHMSEKTGISTENLSMMSLAAQKGGTDIEGVTRGMKFLATQMMNTANETDKTKTILGALGIEAKDKVTGGLRDFNDVIYEIADRFKGMEDGAIKVKLAVGLFGRAGMEMIPMLNMGGAGLRENAELAAKFGIVVSSDAARAAAEFKDKLIDLKASTEGAGRAIGESLMPMLSTLIKGVTDIVTKFKDWAAANPELVSAISSMAFGLGSVLTVAGTLMMVIPTLVTHFVAFAAILGTTAAALATSLAGLTALVAAATFAYTTINNLTKAKEASTEADYRAFESNEKLGQKMREVTDAAGLTRAEFHQLSLKYNDNYAAMGNAIKAGKEGVAMQQALARVGKEHAATLDEQAKKSNTFKTELDKLLEGMGKSHAATKTLKEELGLTFNSELETRIGLIKKALEEYKGQLSVESEKKMREELAKLQDNFLTATGPARDLKGVLEKAGVTMEETGFYTSDLEGEIEKMSDKMGVSINTIRLMAYEIMRLNLEFMGIKMPDIRIPTEPVKKDIKEVKDTLSTAFTGAFADLSKQFGSTFQSFVETWSWDKIINGKINFKSFFNDIWKDIKDTFFRLIGDLAAQWIEGFLEKVILKKTGEALASAATNITSTAASTIGDIAGAAGKGVAGLAGGVINTVANVVSAVTGVLDLLKGPQKQTDVTYWLKMIKDLNQEMHDMMRDMVAIMVYEQGQGDEKWWFAVTLNNLVEAGNRTLADISTGIGNVINALGTVPKAATGAVFEKPTLTWIAENGPEAAIPLARTGNVPQAISVNATGGAGSEQPAAVMNLNANFEIKTVDGNSVRDIVREKIGPELISWLRTNFGKDKLRAALGVAS